MQTAIVDGQPLLLFSCLTGETSAVRKTDGGLGGTWVARADRVIGPYDLADAQLVSGPELYVGKLVQTRDGLWLYLAFTNDQPDGGFGGTIIDPVPARLADGRLVVERTRISRWWAVVGDWRPWDH
jgi:beta-fructofuranosidase